MAPGLEVAARTLRMDTGEELRMFRSEGEGSWWLDMMAA